MSTPGGGCKATTAERFLAGARLAHGTIMLLPGAEEDDAI